MTRKTTPGRVRKARLQVYRPSSLSHITIRVPFAGLRSPYRRSYLAIEMTPGETCFTHRARINEEKKKKRARDYTGGLKSMALVNREFYHGRLGTFPAKLLHQFDSDPRVSLHSREYANKQEKCLLAKNSNRFRLKFSRSFSGASKLVRIKKGRSYITHHFLSQSGAEYARMIFFILCDFFLISRNFYRSVPSVRNVNFTS